MSIINDALKKAQHKRLHQDGSIANQETTRVLKQEATQAKKELKQSKTLLIGLFVLFLLAIIILGQAFVSATKINFDSSIKYKNNPETSTPVDKAGNIILNGIMATDSENLALLNNKIYKEGEIIDGKVITRISLEEVELAENGKKIVLNVRH